MTIGFKLSSIAAGIALAISGHAAVAATAPIAKQLPGKGTIVAGTVQAGTIVDGAQTVTIGDDASGIAVIDWGSGSINQTQPGGFNVGAGATLRFAGANATSNAVLNIDSSGQGSQILGKVDTQGADVSVFIANRNGILVGPTGAVAASGQVGLITNAMSESQQADFDGSPAYAGTGGDVDIVQGAKLTGSSVLVAGGNIVTVDLSSVSDSVPVHLSAGLPSSGMEGSNTAAQLNLVAQAAAVFPGGSIKSAGNASGTGDIDLATSFATVQVAGTFTNGGTLRLGDNAFTGTFDNENVVIAAGLSPRLTVGGLVNNGDFGSNAAPFFSLTTTDGGIVNHGSLYGGLVATQGGGLSNTSHMETSGLVIRGDLTNDGSLGVSGEGIYGFQIVGGNLVNSGTLVGGGPSMWLQVWNGSIINSGRLEGIEELETLSDAAHPSFKAGAGYSISNTGTIIGTQEFRINADHEGPVGANDSTGNFSNTGILAWDTEGGLGIDAWNNVTLGGTLNVAGTGIANGNRLVSAGLFARYGVLTLARPLYTTQGITLSGLQVRVMDSAISTGQVEIDAGHRSGSDYDVRIASATTVSGSQILIQGVDGSVSPSVILLGTLAGELVQMGYQGFSPSTLRPLSDIFAGPAGSIKATGDHPSVTFFFTGKVKNAPYLNASFRYNYLPISVTQADSVALGLDPAAYQTNGTDNGLSAVNILVNGSVTLSTRMRAPAHAGDTPMPGNTPNTHLVLQATGNIQTYPGYDFYWPGYVYLGTIASDDHGSPLPGTLGSGAITTGGEFNNVLAGSTATATGMHFMSQFPLVLGGDVVTNAGAWINFAVDAVTLGYADGTIDTQGHAFYGGTQSPVDGSVSYGRLAPSRFHTHPVDTAK